MTDLEDMERRIRQIFDKAGKELKAKWSEWLKDIDTELAGLQKEYEAAKASGDTGATRKAGIALSRAKKTKIMGNQYYEKMVRQATERLNDANRQAMAYINGKMPGVYASSFNGSTNQIAKDLPHNIGVSFDLVDESTVARLMRDPTLDLHDLQGGINGTKMAAWNNRAISGEILQGIITGDSIPRIAGRLMNVGFKNEKAAIRTARTMTTGAENAGREDSYLRAQDMGIALHQQWIAALDGRTRDSHRQLDGEIAEVGKLFPNGLRFPGDPKGPPEEICNCRCTLIAVLDGFDREKVDRWEKLGGQSYEEWKEGGAKKRLPISANNGIMKQDGTNIAVPDGYDGNFDDFSPLTLTQNELDTLEELHQKALETGIEHGAAIINETIEQFTSGLPNRVHVPEHLQDLDHLNLYHAHTNATTFSSRDLSLLVKPNVDKVSVKASNGDVFTVYIGDGYRPDIDEFIEVERKIRQEVDTSIMDYPEFDSWTFAERRYMAIREEAYRLVRYFGWTMEGGRM